MTAKKQSVIEIPYTPRPLQALLHEQVSKHRWSVLVCHRRFGKTVLAINHLLRDAILCPRPMARFFYVAPTRVQAKAVAWDYCKEFARKIPGVRFNETELRCDLPNGARLQLVGGEEPDRLRGIYADGIVCDEVSSMSERVFPEILRPALSDRNTAECPTYCIFIGTPAGHNAFYDYWELAGHEDGWYRAMLKASETNILPVKELQAASASMSGEQYDQEFECSFIAAVPGSIFGKELQEIEEDGQITKVPYDPGHRVDTFFDLGVNDSTAVWFVQRIGRALHFIDYVEERNEGLPFYARMLDERGYLYGTHHAPHDIEVREMGTGRSRREAAYDLGINFRVVPTLPLEDGIHAAKMLIPRCWFDAEACHDGLEALRYYHRKYDEKNRTFRSSVVHSWASHGADAFRYAAVGIRDFNTYDSPPQITAAANYNPLTSQAQSIL